MMSNKLLAIHDMGIVAAVTFTGALIADLLVLPAVYALQQPAGSGEAATESA
jgi:predicted RND superfamily exporter protein